MLYLFFHILLSKAHLNYVVNGVFFFFKCNLPDRHRTDRKAKKIENFPLITSHKIENFPLITSHKIENVLLITSHKITTYIKIQHTFELCCYEKNLQYTRRD